MHPQNISEKIEEGTRLGVCHLCNIPMFVIYDSSKARFLKGIKSGHRSESEKNSLKMIIKMEKIIYRLLSYLHLLYG